MAQSVVAISEKIMHLNEEQLSEVDHFVDSLQLRENSSLTSAFSVLSERSFEAIWNNPEDDVYDAL